VKARTATLRARRYSVEVWASGKEKVAIVVSFCVVVPTDTKIQKWTRRRKG
jgi:hypothetical protein